MVINDRWVVMELIGMGGMGEVYRVHQLNLKRDIALKIISQKFFQEFGDDPYEAQTCLERFQREVQVMAQIDHPNVLHLYDYGTILLKNGTESNIRYIAMEFIPGATLRSTMSEEGFHPDDNQLKDWLLLYFLPLLDGVETLHKLGVIHRDLKPENILMDGNVPKIADFGLARSHRLKPVTQSKDIKGTPPYMSPEHFSDLKRTDHRTDIYSLGKILYEAASGAISSNEIPFQMACLKNPATSFYQEIDRIIQTATAKDKSQRFSSVEDFRNVIQATIKTGSTEKTSILTGKSTKEKILQGKKNLLFAVALLIFGGLVSIGSIFFHKKSIDTGIPGEGSHIHGIHDQARGNDAGAAGNVKIDSSSQLLQGKDHSIMRLIPAGNPVPPGISGKSDSGHLNSFYMDETWVTNHQYVEFLNQVFPRIKVENEIVRHKAKIWLMIGEIGKGYEPIVFENGKFHVHGAEHAACPVLRVTGYGASAYARFYDKRLPTYEEWLYVASAEKKEKEKETQTASSVQQDSVTTAAHRHEQNQDQVIMPQSVFRIPPPAMMLQPDVYGIRGLNKEIGEWGLKILEADGNKTNPARMEYVILGGHPGLAGKESIPLYIERHPWEAFEGVGFRCVISIANQKK